MIVQTLPTGFTKNHAHFFEVGATFFLYHGINQRSVVSSDFTRKQVVFEKL